MRQLHAASSKIAEATRCTEVVDVRERCGADRDHGANGLMVAPWGVDEGQSAERAPNRFAPEAPQACSRWLSEATPPVEGPFSCPSSHPGGVQASGPGMLVARRQRIASTYLSDEGLHPFRVRISWAHGPVVRADARPPATGLSASGARESRTKRRDRERRRVEVVSQAEPSYAPSGLPGDGWVSHPPG